MVKGNHSWSQQLIVTLLSVGLAFLLTLLLQPLLQPLILPFFFAAVALSARYGGLASGVLATGMSSLLIDYFFLPPIYSFQISSISSVVQLGAFVLVTVLISSLSAELHKAKQRLERNLQKLKESEAQFHLALNNSLITLFHQDQKLRYTWVYHAQDQYLAEKVLGKTDYDLFPALEADRLTASKQHVLQTGQSLRQEFHLTVGNRLCWYDLIIEPLLELSSQQQVIGITCAAYDITHRKQAEEEAQQLLQRSQEQTSVLNAIFSASTDHIYVFDQAGRYLYASNGAAKVLGFEPNQIIGKTWQELGLPTEVMERVDQQRQTVMTTRQTLRDEATFVVADNQHYYEYIMTPLQDVQRLSGAVVVISRDITERKRIEVALRESQELFQHFMENSPSTAYIKDEAGRYIYVNRLVEQLFDRSFDQWIGKTDFDLFPTEAVQEWRKNDLKVLETGETLQALEVAPHNDQPYYFLSFKFLLKNSSGQRLVAGMSIDITEQKRAEEALRESESRFRHLADTAPALIWMSGSDKLCNYFNKGWLNFTGRTMEQEMGNGWAEGVHPDDVQRCLHIYTTSFDARRDFKMEYRLRCFDGEYRWVFDVGIPRFTSDGEFLGYIGSCTDIHDRKQAEEQIQRINEELEQRVEERTAQLQSINKELEAFSYSVSHDLRAPLRHISGFVDLLQKRIQTNHETLDETGYRYLRTIADTAKEAGVLVDDLLSFSRMGRMDMRLTTLDLNQLLKEVKRELEQDLDGRDVEWQITPLPTVPADPTLLRLVFRNLLDNAIKYTRTRKHAMIQIGSTECENEAIVFVKDNGIGFDMRYVHKLFGIFQRLHNDDQFEGTGIGLANVQRIIHRHHGRVWAEAELDRGATFFFSLPLTLADH